MSFGGQELPLWLAGGDGDGRPDSRPELGRMPVRACPLDPRAIPAWERASAGPDKRIAVLGLGNLIYSDDGAGLEALRRLAGHPTLPEGIDLIDGGLGGLEIAALLEDVSRLIILDAVDVGAAPGTVARMTVDRLEGLPSGGAVHQLNIADLLSVLRLMGRMPEIVVLLGIQPETLGLGAFLSPAVESGLPGLVEASLRQIAEWTQGKTRPFRPEPC